MLRRPPRSTQSRSSAASDVYKRQLVGLIASSERSGVGGDSLCSGLRDAGLENDNRLMTGHPAQGFEEALTVGDSLQVHRDDVGLVVPGQVVKEAALNKVGSIAEADKL